MQKQLKIENFIIEDFWDSVDLAKLKSFSLARENNGALNLKKPIAYNGAKIRTIKIYDGNPFDDDSLSDDEIAKYETQRKEALASDYWDEVYNGDYDIIGFISLIDDSGKGFAPPSTFTQWEGILKNYVLQKQNNNNEIR